MKNSNYTTQQISDLSEKLEQAENQVIDFKGCQNFCCFG